MFGVRSYMFEFNFKICGYVRKVRCSMLLMFDMFGVRNFDVGPSTTLFVDSSKCRLETLSPL